MTKWPEKKELKVPNGLLGAEKASMLSSFDGFNYAESLCRKAVLDAVDEGKITEIMIKTKKEYDALTEYEKLGLPKGCDGPRLYAQAIRKHIIKELFGENNEKTT